VSDFAITAASLRREGHEYVVEFTAVNSGEGQTRVTVEAPAGVETSGERLQSEGVQLLVENGKETRGIIRTQFEPKRLVIDRLFQVIDLDRSNNEFSLERGP
jgi:hypothetical protein